MTATAHAVQPPIHAPAPPVQRKAEPKTDLQEAPQRLLTSLSAVPAVQRACAACAADDRAPLMQSPQPSVQRKCAACEAEDQQEQMPVQPQLEVGPVDDPYEREADDIAGRVMAMRDPGSASQAGPSVQRACAACSSKSEEVQRAPAAAAGLGSERIAANSTQLTSGGAALPDQTKGFFEPRMGRDLSDVRVHSGAKSEALNQSISARAFTFQNHIWLSRSESARPSFTMAHELAHVLQQTQPRPATEGPQRQHATAAAPAAVQRAAPAAAAISIGAVVGKCILGAIGGALFDAGIQAILHSIKEWSWRFWEATWDYCSLIISAVVGCITAPVSAATLEPWLAANLGPKLGARQGTLLGKLLLYLAAKVGMGIPSFIVKSLAKLGCISPEEAADLGVKRADDDDNRGTEDPPDPKPAPPIPCERQRGDITGNLRVLMKVDTTDFLTRDEEAKFDRFADSIRQNQDTIDIHGLASVDGPWSYNDRLSCTRAKAIERALQERGIAKSRIKRVVRHGEVAGPKDLQRSVVIDLKPGSTPDRPTPDKPDPDRPTPDKPVPDRPTPDRPTPDSIAPELKLRSVAFTSDHGILKDNKTTWGGNGSTYPQPEWKARETPLATAPITQKKGTRVAAEAEFDVIPGSADPVSIRLRGRGPSGFLEFSGSAFLGGGKKQKIPLFAAETIPDRIDSYLGQSILWTVEINGSESVLDTSFGLDLFATYDDPKGDLTHKRIAKAVELTSGFGNDPHEIVSNQMKLFPFYNLKNAIEGEPWKLADEIPAFGGKGADCQSIVRFVMAVNRAIGLPGEAKGVAVYADPKHPTVPKTSELSEKGGSKGGMHNFPGHALFDEGDNANNYEAAMVYSTAGVKFFPAEWRVKKFYPGGVPGGNGLPSAKRVLYVFKQLATTTSFEMSIDGEPKRVTVPGVTIYCYKNDSPKCND